MIVVLMIYDENMVHIRTVCKNSKCPNIRINNYYEAGKKDGKNIFTLSTIFLFYRHCGSNLLKSKTTVMVIAKLCFCVFVYLLL